jgi:carnitine O-acetyltransferase
MEDDYQDKLLVNGRNVQPYPFLELKSSLPRLPVLPLEDTAKRYVEYLAPLVSEDQLRYTQRLVNEFVKGEGPNLQQELVRLDQESPTSWLEGWWDCGYLEYRVPTFINVNPVFMFKEEALPKSDQISRAAQIVVAACDFYKTIISGSLSPDMEKKTPLCMTQYGRIFSTARVPAPGRDSVYTFTGARHVVVVHKHQFFTFDAIDSQTGQILSVEQVLRNLEEIVRRGSSSHLRQPPIGVLTTEHRDTWATLRKDLIGLHPQNAISLEKIDSALFVLVLDDMAPPSLEAACEALLHGDVHNRWFDKLQFIVFANALSGINMEHAPIDGHTILRLLTHVATNLKPIQQNASSTAAGLSVREVEWVVPTHASLHSALGEAALHATALIQKTQLVTLFFNSFGSRHITSQLKLSPDAFVQMAFQLAYYKLHHRPASTYESSMVKRFYHGRTECLRSVTRESLAFTKKFVSPQATGAEKADALRRAIEAHVKRSNEAKNGAGVDRHWLGLCSLAKHKQQRFPGYVLPRMFTDPNYNLLFSSVLSTSNCGCDVLTLFAFGPVVSNGLGLGYMIHPTSIHVAISSFIGEADTFRRLLDQSLVEMSQVILDNKQVKQQQARL